MKPTWTPDGTRWARLKPTGPNTIRTAWDDVPGCYGQYLRFGSDQRWTPPYTWSGRIRPIRTMIPPVFDSPRPDNNGNVTTKCWYEPAIIFHAMYGTPSANGDSHNIVLGVGRQNNQTGLNLSAEMRDERPERPYGVRTGYVKRDLTPLAASPWDNRWHDFKIDVISHAHYRFWWDSVMIMDVVEKEPVTMYGATGIGLRLDFCDVEFADMKVEGAATVAMYPNGYRNTMITLDRMRELHEPHMHPEFARRLFSYIEAKGGLLGVGGGYRPPGTQPDSSGYAPPGKSFHEGQTWASGLVAYAAVDLVKPNPFNADGNHVAPAWEDTDDAPDWGLHTFIRTPTPEPWHLQPLEIRGWQTWVNNGRQDPVKILLPGDTPPSPPPPPSNLEDEMLYIAKPVFAGATNDTEWWAMFESGAVRRAVNSDVTYAQAKGIPVINQDSKEHHEFLKSIAMT